MKIWHCHLCIRVTLNYVYSPFIIKIMSQKKNTHCRSAFSFSKSLARYLSSLLNLFPPDREPSKFNQSINQSINRSINQSFIHSSIFSFIYSFIYLLIYLVQCSFILLFCYIHYFPIWNYLFLFKFFLHSVYAFTLSFPHSTNIFCYFFHLIYHLFHL